MPDNITVHWQHLHATLRECWVLAQDRRRSAQRPGWTDEATIHTIVVEVVKVEEGYRRQGECRGFLNLLCADERFEMVIVEGVQNPHLAEALMRWGWDFDPAVMDFYWTRGGLLCKCSTDD